MANNKRLGIAFERKVVKRLSELGYWVHFLSPNEAGAQPFDIIAVKHGIAYAIECKTLSEKRKTLSIDRLEDNQIAAFEHWLACGNTMPWIAVGYKEKIVFVTYADLKKERKISIEDRIIHDGYCGS